MTKVASKEVTSAITDVALVNSSIIYDVSIELVHKRLDFNVSISFCSLLITHLNLNTINSESPEVSSSFLCVWLERQTFPESGDDFFSELIGNSVCACVHPERLVNSHLVDDGVKLRTVTDLLTYLCKIVL